MRKAFTLMEMIVALGILAVVMSFAGVIFQVSADSHRLAMANAEIMQKLRAITEQLDADFRGLRKDGEVLVFWRAQRKDPKNYPDLTKYAAQNPNVEEAFDRFDRIMFFADGDFQTYGTYGNPAKPIRGNMARICYALANEPSDNPSDPNRPQSQKPSRRVLARTEHILVPPSTTADPADPLGMSKFTDSDWRDWMSNKETDTVSLRGWELIDRAQGGHPVRHRGRGGRHRQLHQQKERYRRRRDAGPGPAAVAARASVPGGGPVRDSGLERRRATLDSVGQSEWGYEPDG